MESGTVRRSDRIFLELDIQVTGQEVSGREFSERTQTLVLSRHGAKILLQRTLVPQQELIVRCLKTDKEAVASVVGTIGETPEGFYYGIAFLDPEFEMWDIEFPPLPTDEPEGNKTFIECLGCHRLEVAPLDVFELEVLMASQRLLRHCERCGDSSVWRQISEAEARNLPPPPPPPTPPPPPAPLPPTPRPRTHNDRRHPRVAIRVEACLVIDIGKEEFVTTENASVGGFRFLHKGPFQVGARMEVAVPYVRGGVNIFVPARLAYSEKAKTEGLVAYGVCYISEKNASSSSKRPGTP